MKYFEFGKENPELTVTTADGRSLQDHPIMRSNAGKGIRSFFFTGLFCAVMGHPGPQRKQFLAKIVGRSPAKRREARV